MRFTSLVLAVAALSALAACAPQPSPRADVGARTAASAALAAALPEGAAEGEAQARLFISVVAALAPVARDECLRRDATRNCDFQILVDDRPGAPPNAFQTLDRAGRPVIIFTVPLIALVGNADEMAFVMAHEAGHHIAGHLARQQENAALGAAIFGQLAGERGLQDPRDIRAAQEYGAAVGARRYSQDFELEADVIGTIVAARAGFDPLRGAAFFARLPDPGNRFLGTHPPNAARLEIVRQTVAALGL